MYWKDKLEGMNCLSHEDWDKNALWEKLDTRINKKPFSRKVLNGPVVIAACLVLVLGITWITGNKKDAIPDTSNIFKPVDTKKSEHVDNSVQKETTNSKKQYPQPENKVASHPVPLKENIVLPVVPDIIEKQKTETIREENKANTLITTDSVVATFTPPKNLRVVHINEIGKPAVENIRIARASQTGTPSYNKKAVSNFFSNNSDDNIFKIKLSPHN